MQDNMGAPVAPDGLSSFGSSPQAVSPVPASIPSVVLDQVAFAIADAQCLGREGPYGGYDYGYNTDFYGPEPKDGRYVVRDFRSYRSPNWGAWVHQTHDRDEHEQALLRLTGHHIAEAAIIAYAQAMSAGTAETVKPAQGDSPPARSAEPMRPDDTAQDTTPVDAKKKD